MKYKTLGLCVATLILGGCSLNGTWKLAPGQPETDVTVAVMTLASDGTFTSQAKYGNRTEVMSGFYTYANDELTFETGGRTRTYGATRDGDTLTLTHENVSVAMVQMKR